MAQQVALELVSPERLLYSGNVDMVVLPAAEGDMGVLPGQAPVIATIRPGTICIFNSNNVEKRLFVAGGFLEVTAERCTVLADAATPIEEIDSAAVEGQMRDLAEDIAAAPDPVAKAKAESALAIAEAKLRAVTAPAYA